jgi:hypothetical protein
MAKHALLKGGAIALGLAVLGGVFSLYARPDFVFDMANQIWLCF